MAAVHQLQRKLDDLVAMKATLEQLVHCCHGDDRPDCPILAGLAGEGVPPVNSAR